jgi:glycosyltransferase 2 family protein
MIYRQYLISFIKFLLFLGLGLGILYVVYRSQNTAYQADCASRGIPASSCSLAEKVLNDFGSVNYGYILLVLVAFMISNVSRALRLNMLLRPLGARPRLINTFLTTILGYLSNLALPRMGELVRAASLSRYEKIPVEKIMGAVVVDRVMDVLSILTVTVIALLVERGPISAFFSKHIQVEALLGGIGNLLLVLGVVAAVLIAVVYTFRGPLMGSRFFQRVRSIARGFWEGINAVRSLERPWLFLLHTANIWVMFFMMTMLCFWAFEPTAALSARSGLTVFVFGSWGVVVPSPAGMGTFHFMAQQALSIYGVSGEDGFSWANISFFSVNIGSNVLVGLASLILLPIINRNYHPQPSGNA